MNEKLNPVAEIKQPVEEPTEKPAGLAKVKLFMLENTPLHKPNSFMTKSMSNYEYSEKNEDADFEKRKYNFIPAGYQAPQTRSKKKGGPKNSRSFY